MTIGYGPRIVTDGLVLALDAADRNSYPGSGTTWTDLSGNAKNATLVGTPGIDSGNGGSLTFDGTSQYLTADALPSGTNLFTVSFWVYLNILSGNWGTNKAAILFSGSSSGTYELNVRSFDSTDLTPYLLRLGKYGGGTTGSCSVTNINMPIQRWHNVVVVRDGAASQKMYLNGALIVTGNISDSFTAGTMYVGASPFGGTFSGYTNGKFSNVSEYNRALSATEVQQNFQALRGRFGI